MINWWKSWLWRFSEDYERIKHWANYKERKTLSEDRGNSQIDKKKEISLQISLFFYCFCHSAISLITASTIRFDNYFALFSSTFRDLTTELLKSPFFAYVKQWKGTQLSKGNTNIYVLKVICLKVNFKCIIVWRLNSHINHIHERALRIIYQDL